MGEPTAKEIAAGLTEAQRLVLTGAVRPWAYRSYMQVAAALRRKGLFVRPSPRGNLNYLTPLGLAVRIELETGHA